MGQTLEQAESPEGAGTPGLFVIPRDLVLTRPSSLRILLFDQHANLLLCPSLLRAVLYLNLTEYGDNLWFLCENLQRFVLIVSLFVGALTWAGGGLPCLASSVWVVSRTAAFGPTPAAAVITSGVVSGKTLFFRSNSKLLHRLYLFHCSSGLFGEFFSKQHWRRGGKILVVLCHKPQRRVQL